MFTKKNKSSLKLNKTNNKNFVKVAMRNDYLWLK